MSLKDAKNSLNKITKVLSDEHKSREYLIKNTRDIVILSSRAINDIHKGDLKQAKLKIKQADKMLLLCRKKADGALRRYLITPQQELVEACALLAIVEKRPIPGNEALQIPGDSYVLGLLDCIGELKRLINDKIRIGDAKEAARVFEVMEDLYTLLYPFAIYDKMVQDARRKLDVNRILVEDTRLALTEEIRRSALIDALKKKRAE
jgi:translin